MKKKAAVIALMAALALALGGSGPCEEQELGDSINPMGKYFSLLVRPGAVVKIYSRLAYLVNQFIYPTTLDPTTVTVCVDDPACEADPGCIPACVPGVVEGFENQDCMKLNYIVLLEIFTWTDYDLSATAGWINLRAYGRNLRVQLPNDLIEGGQTLVLYVARDGSTYYAIDDYWFPDANLHTHDLSFGFCDAPIGICPSFTPDLAFDPAHLAAAASTPPSLEPFVLHGNSIDQTEGVNGGIIDAPGWDDVYFTVIAIENDPPAGPVDPYYGWDQLNNQTDFGLGYLNFFEGYVTRVPAFLFDYPVPCPLGVLFTACDDPANVEPPCVDPCDLPPETDFELILDGVVLADGTPLPDTEIPFSTGPAPLGYAPDYCVFP